ncbi:TPA: IS256 family transposase [Legionella pneumophila]|nr:IS256 family transposase [Legionella pneumophila]HEM6734754.1 IS256 family transposase [Legionella pneumophila]HEO1519797.1 IS256 family transposase [Legionella pneumophila]HEO1521329.1 IS256 family transposase [Legionella pneumophila]
MTDCKLNAVQTPIAECSDPLTELLRTGAQALIRQAVETELEALLTRYQGLKLLDGRRAVVRNGYLPERTVQTGIGDVNVRVPKVRDRSGSGIHFTSQLLPPYLKRTKTIEELLPWLYLKGISTGDFSEALVSLLGEHAKGLSANTISRLKGEWLDEHRQWAQADLSNRRYVYLWADGIYSQVRLDDRLCLLVIIGVTEHGTKELVAVADGYRESSASWEEVLMSLRQRGLNVSPRLATGDGALGFWSALDKVYPDTRHQRCWVHKTANVLNKLPKTMQPRVKEALQQIWMAPTRDAAHKAFDDTVVRFGPKYPQAMECLKKDREDMLAFYDFPAEHWIHIRTTNPIESAFSTVRLRTRKSRNCGSRDTTLAMVYKLLQSAEKRWKKIKGFGLLTLVVNNVQFKDGEQVVEQLDRNAA